MIRLRWVLEPGGCTAFSSHPNNNALIHPTRRRGLKDVEQLVNKSGRFRDVVKDRMRRRAESGPPAWLDDSLVNGEVQQVRLQRAQPKR